MTTTLRPHGTEAAYRRHRRAGEDPCAACKAGHAAHIAAQRARRAGRV